MRIFERFLWRQDVDRSIRRLMKRMNRRCAVRRDMRRTQHFKARQVLIAEQQLVDAQNACCNAPYFGQMQAQMQAGFNQAEAQRQGFL